MRSAGFCLWLAEITPQIKQGLTANPGAFAAMLVPARNGSHSPAPPPPSSAAPLRPVFWLDFWLNFVALPGCRKSHRRIKTRGKGDRDMAIGNLAFSGVVSELMGF